MLMLPAAVCSSMAFMLPVGGDPAPCYVDMKDLMSSGRVLTFIGVFLWMSFPLHGRDVGPPRRGGGAGQVRTTSAAALTTTSFFPR
ncbi:hypothetical protein [uncultured Methanofollis sp.]|uniref:hypothetical protein n=1 Tax=uncultured Methanofollis sp. TaxID=262500 RepID=UPI00263181B8|nr:hypothetical protein [uncultured Methanofollis sp.]